MLLFLADLCISALGELQETEIEGDGSPNRKHTFPSFHCLMDRQIHRSYLFVFIL